jgi:type III restriction enzyme
MINLFEFQERTVSELIYRTSEGTSRTIIVKSPTGSGKTIILIEFIKRYLECVDRNTAFIWLCPGKGDLEEQSRSRMKSIAPEIRADNIADVINGGFKAGSATFINWELVTKAGNSAVRDGEKSNLFDRIAKAKGEGLTFIVIIDEEHSNNTAKAKFIIDAFEPKNIIRVSATAVENKKCDFIEIDELDVIEAGLITKALYVNEGISDGMQVGDDYDCLLSLADDKRKEIAEHYLALNKNIRPLVLIQFPSGHPETISAVERKLAGMGYTYDNGLVAKWMSEDKRDLDENLTRSDGTAVFLLMKQAISTGWDCPRAKILVKLREGMSESFEIQTIGRIRRMPEARHYDDDVLDFCYVYTFDEKYKSGLLANVDKAYETRRLFLKPEFKKFALEKQMRDFDVGGLGEREVLIALHDYLVKKYNLGRDKQHNKTRLQEGGYVFGTYVLTQALEGQFVRTNSVAESGSFRSIHRTVDTHRHGILLLHSVDSIKSSIGMQTAKVKTILERLFRDGGNMSKNIVALDTKEFYSFVINNEKKLKEDFQNSTADMSEQMSFALKPKYATFRFPEQDFYKYDPLANGEEECKKNVFAEYTTGFATPVVKGICGVLFEKYCEECDKVEWVYSNGSYGQKYFSIAHIDGLRKQWLFYPDYIVKTTDGNLWLIETRGEESKWKKNRAQEAENKFKAFCDYAERTGVSWGFVRVRDGQLVFNNTQNTGNLAEPCWKNLNEIL